MVWGLENINNSSTKHGRIILKPEDIRWLRQRHPKLTILNNNIIQGKFNFRWFYFFEQKKVSIKGEYFLEINLNRKKNSILPNVKETNNDFEKISEELNMNLNDLHINNDQTFCLALHQREKDYFLNSKFSLEIFFEKLLEPFLYWISFYKKYKKPPWPGYEHFGQGEIEYLIEELKKEDEIDDSVKDVLKYENDKKSEELLKTLKLIKGHHKCLCGSQKIIRKCHKIFRKCPKILKYFW